MSDYEEQERALDEEHLPFKQGVVGSSPTGPSNTVYTYNRGNCLCFCYDMVMKKVIVVDDKDNPIDLKTYSELAYEDIYRVSALWLTDAKTDDILMTQRKLTKHHDPGKWMAAASGTIEEGETYDENIVHEIEEEIGLYDLQLTKGPKEFTDDGQHKYFVQWYLATTDKDTAVIQIQEEEVEAHAWVPKQQLLSELAEDPTKFVPSFKKDLKALTII